MKNGDIDNSIAHRWMVTLEALTGNKKLPEKTWRKSWDTVARETPIEPLALGRCWQWADRAGVRFECIVFNRPHEYAEALEQHLDRLGAHPIVWVSVYRTPMDLQRQLAFRPDVTAVLDTKERAGMWGSRGYVVSEV